MLKILSRTSCGNEERREWHLRSMTFHQNLGKIRNKTGFKLQSKAGKMKEVNGRSIASWRPGKTEREKSVSWKIDKKKARRNQWHLLHCKRENYAFLFLSYLFSSSISVFVSDSNILILFIFRWKFDIQKCWSTNILPVLHCHWI